MEGALECYTSLPSKSTTMQILHIQTTTHTSSEFYGEEGKEFPDLYSPMEPMSIKHRDAPRELQFATILKQLANYTKLETCLQPPIKPVCHP